MLSTPYGGARTTAPAVSQPRHLRTNSRDRKVEAGAGSAVNDTTREVGGTLGVAVLGSIVASVYTTKVGPRVDANPDVLMTPYEKSYARETVISVLEIVNRPTNPLFATQKTDLIYTMKSACLEGFQVASYLTVGASLLVAVTVAIFLPWKPDAHDSVLLAWKNSPEDSIKGSDGARIRH